MATVALVSWQRGTGRTTLLAHLGALLGTADGRAWTLDLNPSAGTEQGPADLPPHWLAERLRQVGAFEAEWLLIDTPAGPTPWTREAVHLAHLVLVVTRPDANDFCALPEVLAWIAETRGERLPSPAVRVVVTQHRSNDGVARQIYSGIGLRMGRLLAPPVRYDQALRHLPDDDTKAAGALPWPELEDVASGLGDVQRLALWLTRQCGLLAQHDGRYGSTGQPGKPPAATSLQYGRPPGPAFTTPFPG